MFTVTAGHDSVFTVTAGHDMCLLLQVEVRNELGAQLVVHVEVAAEPPDVEAGVVDALTHLQLELHARVVEAEPVISVLVHQVRALVVERDADALEQVGYCALG